MKEKNWLFKEVVEQFKNVKETRTARGKIDELGEAMMTAVIFPPGSAIEKLLDLILDIDTDESYRKNIEKRSLIQLLLMLPFLAAGMTVRIPFMVIASFFPNLCQICEDPIDEKSPFIYCEKCMMNG
jgi:hypothetical protein